MKQILIVIALSSLIVGCHSTSIISEVDYGWSKTSVNAAIFRKNSLVSNDKFQYISFYDSIGNVVLGKRKHGKDDWRLHTTQYQGNVWDAHNVISIMVDGDGYLHVSWDHHDGPLNYARSIEPRGLELGPRLSMTNKQEDRGVTYPEFYALPDGGMYFVYRYGASGAGNMVLNRYHLDEKRWERIHNNLISGEGKRNAYWQMAVDNEGDIHLSYVWRDTWDVSTNHNLCYARSSDGGRTWKTSTGKMLPVPITYDTSEIAMKIPQNSNLINQTSMTTDANGNPAIASYWTAEGETVTQFFIVYHDGTQWHSSQATNRKTPFSLAGGGTRRIPISRPQLLSRVEGDETFFYLIYRDAEVDDRVVISSASTVEGMQWKRKVIDELEVAQWEPSYDTELWRNKGILSLYVQKVGQGEGGERAVEMAPQMVKVFQLSPSQLKTFF
ncbi:BNR repeat-containing protein [Natronoflexus pectinivorans]|uniref:Putative BNR repeat neuraminidase n=1 Tax=Natronoflexus pectinivorans TaxID=682526 RepID=A0A4R2GIV1_9BACT|nr:BNR repeat-containing protein [Natronoflexus pectinivorans]TCO07247.1 putative BNR repeat neuraminidase [Natronoflexus pectinivorans]